MMSAESRGTTTVNDNMNGPQRVVVIVARRLTDKSKNIVKAKTGMDDVIKKN